MDVDVPRHPIESRRDFFIHLFTITCGLLIALALEGLVEWSHHMSLVHEARMNIRQELENNKDAANKNLASIEKQIATTKADLATEHRMQRLNKQPNGLKNFHGSLSFSFEWSSISDAAWQTARDTGALGYMKYADVQGYAEVYSDQAQVQSAEEAIYSDDANAYAPLAAADNNADAMPDGELQHMIDATSDAYTHLTFLKQLTTQLRDTYAKTLAGR